MGPQYAVVAYVRTALGRWVEDLRSELHPEHAHLPAHISILPPRPLISTEHHALELLESACRTVQPFEVTLGEVETFIPTTPTVFLQVAHAGYKLRELHDLLNTGPLQAEEPWPYMPHLTIVKTSEVAQAEAAAQIVRERWARYQGSRRMLVDELTFVRERENFRWDDLAPIQLGRELASKTR
jgi:2'-5' RNA ligase